VGFPTETDEDHANTVQLLEAAPMTYLHVFPYSHRPGTPSASLKPEVHGRIAQQRGKELRELSLRKNRAFRNSFLGRDLSLITLAQDCDERAQALSTNYLKVELSNCLIEANQILSAEITGLTDEGLRGEIKQHGSVSSNLDVHVGVA
jgi:threonylcarbamoyladenosine tRNA methylthiotransferase MtaB